MTVLFSEYPVLVAFCDKRWTEHGICFLSQTPAFPSNTWRRKAWQSFALCLPGTRLKQ
jgi:hypothetical protein